MMIRFIVFDKNRKIITGGHKYDRMLFDSVKKLDKVDSDFSEVGAKPNLPKILRPVVEFSKGIKESKGDCLIFNSSACLRLFPLMVWNKLFPRRKTYVIHHHFIYLEFSGLKKFIYKNAEKYFLKLSDKIIVPSPYIYEKLKDYKKEKDLLHWRIPFETQKITDTSLIPGNLTYTGTIEPRKGLIYLLQSLKKIQDNNIKYTLNIIGKVIHERYYNSLKDYANENDLNVNFLGFIDLEEKNRILAETDIFVFPSLLEGFGMVLVEAQVYGLPIVSFDNSAMPFTVKNDINGYTVPNLDINAMAQKIQEIIINRELRERLSKGALENLKEQWNNDKFLETIRNYFNSLS